FWARSRRLVGTTNLPVFPCRYFSANLAAMLAKIYSAAVYGVDAYEVEIEVNGAGGDPNIVIVGLPDAAVKESRDRVTTAIANCAGSPASRQACSVCAGSQRARSRYGR